ncbi:hypothetical protein CYMTET_13802 [Cymbomonas tetramitiformis]|uniref:Uncharacterized protein n=1 Tax=Cymbomonas tetramitiformis TaxID=36881 RepID=A0AAE0GHS6_9CHLO|nr:hypothetical protein CYMTET_13802 [Cymbomonas tetramitiformis]
MVMRLKELLRPKVEKGVGLTRIKLEANKFFEHSRHLRVPVVPEGEVLALPSTQSASPQHVSATPAPRRVQNATTLSNSQKPPSPPNPQNLYSVPVINPPTLKVKVPTVLEPNATSTAPAAGERDVRKVITKIMLEEEDDDDGLGVFTSSNLTTPVTGALASSEEGAAELEDYGSDRLEARSCHSRSSNKRGNGTVNEDVQKRMQERMNDFEGFSSGTHSGVSTPASATSGFSSGSGTVVSGGRKKRLIIS